MDKKPKTLQEAIRYYSDEQVCIDTVAALRWPNGPECPACTHKEHYYLKTQKRWKCKECYKQFTVKLGTIFEDSPLSLDKWLCALWMLVNCKNGVSSYEIHRALAVTQKSAWFMLQRLRLALKGSGIEKIGGSGSEVEVDETYIGGKVHNMHKEKKIRMMRERGDITFIGRQRPGNIPGKVAVHGMLDRESRQIRAMVVPNIKRETLQKDILDNVHAGTTVYTDQATAYDHLRKNNYTHAVVNHLQEYVRGRVHTNGIENFWSLLKRGLSGTYVAVEPFHLFRYVDEQVFRYNNRGTKKQKINDGQRFEIALSQVAGKRLTFAEATGKVGETAF